MTLVPRRCDQAGERAAGRFTGTVHPVVVVGPAHPERGGVVAHTAELVNRRHSGGRPTLLITWSRSYPRVLHPAGRVPSRAVPDVPVVPDARALLRWDRPWSWRRAGREAAGAGGSVVLVHVMAAQAPALMAVGRGVRDHDPRVPLVLVAHNVLPHERHLGDRRLCAALFRSVDHVIVHTAQNAAAATALGARRVHLVPLPPHLPGGPRRARDQGGHGRLRVLFLGAVRGYKGVPVLLDAVARVPEARLTVAGEHWGRSGGDLRARLARDPSLRQRVALEDRYVPADELAGLFAAHDVVALPYLSGSGSQNADLAFAHGLPVLASRIPTFVGRVRDGVDGLLLPAGDADALAGALRGLCDRRSLDHLTAQVRAPDVEGAWRTYLAVLEDCSTRTGARVRVAD